MALKRSLIEIERTFLSKSLVLRPIFSSGLVWQDLAGKILPARSCRDEYEYHKYYTFTIGYETRKPLCSASQRLEITKLFVCD
jgi:hypothetical protein